ncbi:ABC transporter permease [Streptomyces hydrogenans]|uniref:ABC transporter permease n=1 Tax=Streptomyces hydrogenans TaxID=1873719 RepID=UPI00278C2671|nr:ABC transporter permease [Streptomyces hydrogenans]
MSALSLKGPAWVTVRQYRRTLWLALALALFALAVVAGLRIWAAQNPVAPAEDGVWIASPYNGGYLKLRWILEYVGGAAIVLPGVVAAVVAGPMVAREYESGTYQLSLTQSVRPVEWLRSKLTVATVFATLAALAVMGVFWLGRLGVRQGWDYHWGHVVTYAASGVTVFAYVLAAVAVGALVGQLVRRTLLAMSAAGLVMGAVLAAFTSYRWSLMPVERLTGPLHSGPRITQDGLQMGSGMLTPAGTDFDQAICWDEVQRVPGVDIQEGLWDQLMNQCYARNGVTTEYVDYHPASHFWPTQLIETGIVLALAALAAFAAFRVLRARHP